MPLSLSLERVSTALAAWDLPAPLIVSELGEGFQGENWLVEAGGLRYVAKIGYDTQEHFEFGLRMAALVERHGIPCGAPLHTVIGALSVLVAHPPGHRHPLALLHFVPGRPLDLALPEAQSQVGNLLGRVHRILRDEAHLTGPGDAELQLLSEDNPALFARYSWLRPLLLRAVADVVAFEAGTAVTYGGIMGDFIEVLRDEATGSLGIIDWGGARRGPLLFDLALATLQFRRVGATETGPFLAAYTAEAPTTREELAGLDRYLTLLWARQTRYWAWRIANNVTRGDPERASAGQTLSLYRQRLEAGLSGDT